MVSGLTYEYPEVIRPALQVLGTRQGVTRAAGVYLMVIEGRSYLFTDATVNIDPDAETLSEIAILANDFAHTLGLEPRVAMLSFSNFGSTPHPHSDKVSRAVQLVRGRRPDITVDGEMQADTAVVIDIIEQRFPFSQVQDANVLVFPNLDAANISYKLLSRLTNAEAIGPICSAWARPCTSCKPVTMSRISSPSLRSPPWTRMRGRGRYVSSVGRIDSRMNDVF